MESKQTNLRLTTAQQEFMKNILLPKKPLSKDEELMKKKNITTINKK